MQLTPNFTLEEVEHSNTAIALKLDNKASESDIENAKALAENVLQPLRDKLGHRIQVNCWLRKILVNKAVGGVATSQHVDASASDIENTNGTNKELGDSIIEMGLPFDQLIFEDLQSNGDYSWIHVSYNNKKGAVQRGQALEMKKVNGKSTYKPYIG